MGWILWLNGEFEDQCSLTSIPQIVRMAAERLNRSARERKYSVSSRPRGSAFDLRR